MTDLRNAVEDRPSQYNTNTYGSAEPSFGTRNAGYGSTQQATPMPATEYYQSRWDQLKDQSWFPMAVVGGVVALFALFVGYAYNQGSSDAGAGGTAPVIAAADEPFKTAPTDAGGMVVPNQDTLVFDQITQPSTTATTADGQAAATETLVPPPEAPLVSADDAAIKAAATETPAATTATAPVAEATQPAPQPAPATTVAAMTAGENAPKPAPTAAAPTTPAAAAPAVEAKKPEAPKPVAKVAETPKAVAAPKPTPAPKAVAPTPAPAPAPVAQTKPAVLPPVATTPAAPAPTPAPVAAAPTPTPAVSSGTAKVQLGAFGSEAAARAAWQTFQQKYGAQLGGVTPNFARADLGAKGVVYRVQGVGLSAASATSICQAINAQAAGGCIVAK